jgi:hypothetical protein
MTRSGNWAYLKAQAGVLRVLENFTMAGLTYVLSRAVALDW